MPETDDVVTWGDGQRGRVLHVMTEGTLDVPGGDSVEATPDDPAILVAVWEETDGEWVETDRVAGGRASDFTVVEDDTEDDVPDDAPTEDLVDGDTFSRSAAPALERRSADARWEVREAVDGSVGIIGYAAVFDSPAHGEVVSRSAFDRTLAEGAVVELLFDHAGIPLASTRGGTMTLRTDDTGLVVEVPSLDVEGSSYAASVVSALRRGDLAKMSFSFFPVRESIDRNGTRVLEDVELVDASIVTRPWYDATSVALKSDATNLVEARAATISEPDDTETRDDVAVEAEATSDPANPSETIGDTRMSHDDMIESVEARSEETVPAAELESRVAAVEARTDLEARIAELESRSTNLAETRAYDAVARVEREERTYNPDADRRGISFISDVISRTYGDVEAAQRLARHSQEERTDRGSALESRAIGTSALGAIVVPQYLVDLYAPALRAGRPLADIANRMALPAEGMTVEIPRITTGTSAAVQATQNTGASETNLDETTLSVPVVTIAGQQTVSLQGISRGRGTEQIIVRDLVSAYNTALDSQLINGAGSSGEHRGIRNVSGIVSVTYTDTDPTAAEAYPKLFDLVQQVQSGAFRGVTHFVMHPRRWAFFAAAVGSNSPFLQAGSNVDRAAGQFATPGYGGVAGNIMGVDVILDANIPTNLGTATNQDVILGVSADELHLWEDAAAPLLIRAEQTNAASLGVLLVVFGFSAFTAGRVPGAHGIVTGSGLATPSF
jgi:HK97 family phage prohead protease/HK97 family phage major capsid protein